MDYHDLSFMQNMHLDLSTLQSDIQKLLTLLHDHGYLVLYHDLLNLCIIQNIDFKNQCISITCLSGISENFKSNLEKACSNLFHSNWHIITDQHQSQAIHNMTYADISKQNNHFLLKQRLQNNLVQAILDITDGVNIQTIYPPNA